MHPPSIPRLLVCLGIKPGLPWVSWAQNISVPCCRNRLFKYAALCGSNPFILHDITTVFCFPVELAIQAEKPSLLHPPLPCPFLPCKPNDLDTTSVMAVPTPYVHRSSSCLRAPKQAPGSFCTLFNKRAGLRATKQALGQPPLVTPKGERPYHSWVLGHEEAQSIPPSALTASCTCRSGGLRGAQASPEPPELFILTDRPHAVVPVDGRGRHPWVVDAWGRTSKPRASTTLYFVDHGGA